MEVKVMPWQGASIRAIARQTGLWRATVRKTLRAPAAHFPSAQRVLVGLSDRESWTSPAPAGMQALPRFPQSCSVWPSRSLSTVGRCSTRRSRAGRQPPEPLSGQELDSIRALESSTVPERSPARLRGITCR